MRKWNDRKGFTFLSNVEITHLHLIALPIPLESLRNSISFLTISLHTSSLFCFSLNIINLIFKWNLSYLNLTLLDMSAGWMDGWLDGWRLVYSPAPNKKSQFFVTCMSYFSPEEFCFYIFFIMRIKKEGYFFFYSIHLLYIYTKHTSFTNKTKQKKCQN